MIKTITMIIVVSLIVVGGYYFFQGQNELGSEVGGEDVRFMTQVGNIAGERVGQPIEGYTGEMYLEALPGLLREDLVGVETYGGVWMRDGLDVRWQEGDDGEKTTADEALTPKGHGQLLENVRGRLGADLDVETVVARLAESDMSSTLPAEPNLLYVGSQQPGDMVTILIAKLEQDGFVVIHQADDGAPGDIVAASALIPSGGAENVSIPMPIATQDGEQYIAMLHTDNGNGSFDAQEDAPIIGEVIQEPIMMQFEIDVDAEEAEVISI